MGTLCEACERRLSQSLHCIFTSRTWTKRLKSNNRPIVHKVYWRVAIFTFKITMTDVLKKKMGKIVENIVDFNREPESFKIIKLTF